MTIEQLTGLATILITLLFGWLSKKFDWIESKYIPYQNLCIGLLAGVLCYVVGINENLTISILTCLTSSMCAGGTYDALRTKGK